MTQTILDKAIKFASKKLAIKSDKALNQNLKWAAGDLAEAYRIGAEEAQGEIVSRLRRLQGLPPTTTNTDRGGQ